MNWDEMKKRGVMIITVVKAFKYITNYWSLVLAT